MKSIKPGRGPSMQGGMAYIFGAVFCVIWSIGAASMGAPAFFVLFGVIGVIMCLVSAGFHFYNATAKNRHSVMDIVEDDEEPDPLNAYFGAGGEGHVPEEEKEEMGFCPYCGEKVKRSFVYCPKCGKNMRQ